MLLFNNIKIISKRQNYFQVRESIESTSYDLDGNPAAEIFFCCGFFLIYFIEELVHCLCDSKVHSDDKTTNHVHEYFAFYITPEIRVICPHNNLGSYFQFT